MLQEGRCGYTALHYACENSNEQLAKYILTECAQLDVETCSYGMLTAYQLAADQRNPVLMSALQQYGAEVLSPPDTDDTDSEDDDETNTTSTHLATSSQSSQSAHQTTIAQCS